MDESKNIHKGHRKRLKKEFLEHGTDGFSEVRALELLLFYALARQDTNPLAHRLLDRFGSLHGVLSASVVELCTVDGIAENTAILIRLIPEMFRLSEYGRRQIKNDRIDSSFTAGNIASSCFAGESNEKFMLFCLDSHYHYNISFPQLLYIPFLKRNIYFLMDSKHYQDKRTCLFRKNMLDP